MRLRPALLSAIAAAVVLASAVLSGSNPRTEAGPRSGLDVTAVDAIGMTVSDMDRAVDFYSYHTGFVREVTVAAFATAFARHGCNYIADGEMVFVHGRDLVDEKIARFLPRGEPFIDQIRPGRISWRPSRRRTQH